MYILFFFFAFPARKHTVGARSGELRRHRSPAGPAPSRAQEGDCPTELDRSGERQAGHGGRASYSTTSSQTQRRWHESRAGLNEAQDHHMKSPSVTIIFHDDALCNQPWSYRSEHVHSQCSSIHVRKSAVDILNWLYENGKIKTIYIFEFSSCGT